MVLVACVAWIGCTSEALAATPGQSYGYKSDIGTSGGDGFFPLFNSVAVSRDDGNVFLARQNDSQFGVIDPSGNPITQAPTSFGPKGVAVSPDGSTVFITNSLYEFGIGGPVLKYTSDGAPTPTYTEDSLWAASASLSQITGIAIDPVTGDVLVGAAGGIRRFDASTGALLGVINGSTTEAGPFGGDQIAVAPNRDIYVTVSAGRVEHMGADGSWKGQLKVPIPDTNIPPSGIAVNPQNGDVAVELLQGADTVIKIYTSADELKDTVRVPPAAGGGHRGLAYAPDGSQLYIGLADGTAHVFPLGTRPGVDAPAASQITTTGARLTGAVATAGESTTARIEWCLPTDPCAKYLSSDPGSPWQRLPDHTGLTGPGEDSISDDITGLAPNTRYLVRTYAINDNSQVEAVSATGSFTTAVIPPAVVTGAASSDDTTATLAGTIDAIGDQTTYHFEYGLTTNYGGRAPANSEGIAGTGRTPRTFTQMVKGLQPGTTYHYRLVATNSAGTTAGADRTFTTLGADQVAPGRGYEQVSSPNKNGLVLFSNYGFQAAPDGSAVVYSAASPATDASSAAQASRYLARRVGAGAATNWIGQQPLDPPLAPTRAILTVATQAVSGDFKHTMVVSKKALTPGAIEGGANLYVNDVETGAYHLIGSSGANGAYPAMVGPNTMNTFVAGAPDFSWLVVSSPQPLMPGAPPRAFYRWTKSGGLSLISLLPGDAVPTGSVWFQSSVQSTNRLVSDDGSTLAFSLVDGEGGVYWRKAGQTVPISVSQASGGPTGVQSGIADGMDRDGRYVVFHSSAQLTDGATDPGPKMYRYDSKTGGLAYLGPQDGSRDGSPDVLGISDDGSTVYFHSNNQVVVWRDGQVDLVSPTALRGSAAGFPSPNGRYFEFVPGDGTVHLYDAVAGEETCVSCAADTGTSVGGRIGGAPDRNLSNRYPQVVTDDGHAYFDTTTALLPADRNGTSDVYEYYKGRRTLISPGDRDFIAALSDISADGSTVFFTTPEGLVNQDTDQDYDLYAARVGGGLSAQNPVNPTAPCAKAECAEPGPGPVVSPPMGSPPQPVGARSKRTNQAKVKLSLTRVGIGRKTMKITFHASERGRVTVSGTRVVRSYRNVTKAGTYTVSVRLSKKAQSLARAKKKFKVSVKVSLAGGWGTSSAKYSRTLNK